MTVLAHSELSRNKLVLCFLDSKTPAHRPFSRIDLLVEELLVWNRCSFLFDGTCFKENRFGLIATHDLAMHECMESFRFGPHNTPFSVCRQND